MTAVGLTWLGTATGSSVRSSASSPSRSRHVTVLLVALVLAYPSGRLESGIDRAAVAILAVGATALNILYSTSLPLIADKSSGLYGGLALATMTTAVILRRWVIAPARSRRDLLPVLIAGLVFMVTLLINIVRRIADIPDDVGAVLIAASDLAPAAIPVALLIGFYRQSERRQRALVEALPDRMIRFTTRAATSSRAATDVKVPRRRWPVRPSLPRPPVPGGWGIGPRRDGRGARHRGPAGVRLLAGPARRDPPVRGADRPERGGRGDGDRPRLHDPADGRGGAQTVAGEDPRGGRRRAPPAGARPPRRRPAAPRLAVAGAAPAAGPARRGGWRGPRSGRGGGRGRGAGQDRDPGAARARPRHPPGDPHRGRAWGPRSPRSRSDRRSPPRSGPSRIAGCRSSSRPPRTSWYRKPWRTSPSTPRRRSASVAAACDSDTLRVEVADDGVGGADQARGTGIRGLQDRVAALGGRLTVNSPLGEGTRVTAEIPIG